MDHSMYHYRQAPPWTTKYHYHKIREEVSTLQSLFIPLVVFYYFKINENYTWHTTELLMAFEGQRKPPQF